jgi:putative transposase
MDWKYVLSRFGKTGSKARGMYLSHMKEGIGLGRRPELVGGGLIRSLGGWEAVKRRRLETGERAKGEQRILGDSDFVLGVLAEWGRSLKGIMK